MKMEIKKEISKDLFKYKLKNAFSKTFIASFQFLSKQYLFRRKMISYHNKYIVTLRSFIPNFSDSTKRSMRCSINQDVKLSGLSRHPRNSPL